MRRPFGRRIVVLMPLRNTVSTIFFVLLPTGRTPKRELEKCRRAGQSLPSFLVAKQAEPGVAVIDHQMAFFRIFQVMAGRAGDLIIEEANAVRL